MCKKLFILLALITAFYPAAHGTETIIEDFLVNDDTVECDQFYPTIAADPSGNFVITWEDKRNGNWDIYAQRYNSSGTPLGSNFKVNDDPGTVYQYFPAVAMDNSGNFIIAWEDYRNSHADIYFQRYDFSGIPIDSNIKVNDDVGSAYQYSPTVAVNSSGNFIITWRDFRNIDYDIYAQIYDSLGNPIDSNFRVNDIIGTAGAVWPAIPVIAMDAFGNFVIAWEDYRDLVDIYAQRYNSSGTPLGPNFKVNDDIAIGDFPAVAMDISGNFVICWLDSRYAKDNIYGQRYNSLGTALGSNFMVNDSASTAQQLYSAVDMDSSGNFVIAWQELYIGNNNIYAQRYNSSGTPIGSNYLVPNLQDTSFNQRLPGVAVNSSNICFIWQDDRRGEGWDIYGKIVDWTWSDVEEEIEANVPYSFNLSQNYPNPFNTSTNISFTVCGSCSMSRGLIPTTLKIYNVKGQLVRILVDEEKALGNYNVAWDGKNEKGRQVSSGVYFYRLKCGEYSKYSKAKKMILVK